MRTLHLPLAVLALAATLPAQLAPHQCPAPRFATWFRLATLTMTPAPNWQDPIPARWRTAANAAVAALEDAPASALQPAIDAAIQALGDTHPHTVAKLRDTRATEDPASVVEAVIDDLRFTPYSEASQPAGFPEPAPVGEIVLKSYPRYRMARTEMASRGGMNISFWRLFQHIKTHDIQMTAPVQIDYANAAGTSPASMAFLYGSPTLGADGSERQVDVVDVEPCLTLTIGARGYETAETIAALHTRLCEYLGRHADELVATAPMRTMGYNSPMVPKSRRFFEVEIPVRRR